MAEVLKQSTEATKTVFDGIAKIGVQATLLVVIVAFLIWQNVQAMKCAEADKVFQRGQTKLLAEVVTDCTTAVKNTASSLQKVEQAVEGHTEAIDALVEEVKN